MGVKEVRWKKEDTVRARNYTFVYGKERENNNLEQDFVCNTE